MKKKEIVRDKTLFNSIIHNNKFWKSNYFVIYIRKSEFFNPRFGIAVSKKIGNAVVRNKLKRRYRMIIDNNSFLFPKYNDYIIMVKRDSLMVNFQELNKSMEVLLKERGNK